MMDYMDYQNRLADCGIVLFCFPSFYSLCSLYVSIGIVMRQPSRPPTDPQGSAQCAAAPLRRSQGGRAFCAALRPHKTVASISCTKE